MNYAPVTDANMIESIPKMGFHQVCQGETLYEIAWRYGLDYRYLAERNRLKPPFAMKVGQKIFLQGGNATVLSAVISDTPEVTTVAQVNPTPIINPVFTNGKWSWPAHGKLIGSFSEMHKGINIAGASGQPIYATASGKVVYCGNGLRGYGNLIILKHDNIYFSAYAHSRILLVKEGEMVKQGQKIAEMGNTGTDKVMLHFEIRNAGKPVDPISLLGG